MCVICIVKDKRPTPGAVQAMFEANDHGGGVAWREDGKVKWDKNLGLEEMQQYALELPVPYILHFRIASSGGRYSTLTHPFSIDERISPDLMGESEEGVLFHNGTWTMWESRVKDFLFAAAGKIKLPPGRWNDTRAFAFFAHHLGLGALDFFADSNKLAVLTTDDIYMVGSWTLKDDLLVSNTHWDSRACYRGEGKGSSETGRGATGYHTTAPHSLVRTIAPKGTYHGEHDPDARPACNCKACCDARADRINRHIEEREGGGGPTEATPFEVTGEALLDSLSKKALKRLRKRALYCPDKVTEVEKEALRLDRIRQAEKLGMNITSVH